MRIKNLTLGLICVVAFGGCLTGGDVGDSPCTDVKQPLQLAQKPPMGWNSYDCYGSAVTEAEVRANADYMAEHLAQYGWEYIVVDFCWSHPSPGAVGNPDLDIAEDGTMTPALAMDEYGRLLPAPERFPSAAGGKGFKPLADYVHGKGLKFGIHVMRGIPRQAVHKNLPVFETNVRAKDIANQDSICTWLNHMYGLDMTKPGAQAYYDSLLRLYAEWDVDYIKVDDMIAGAAGIYHTKDVEGFHYAIEKCGRPIVLSLSPGGGTPLAKAQHLQQHSNLWRISADFWDEWPKLKKQFDLCEKWAPHTGPGAWADADMICFGKLALRGPKGPPNRQSRFTEDEHITLMTLWAIFRSPLMFGGNLPDNDAFTLSLLTNEVVLAVNQNSVGNRPLFRRGDHIGWIADVPDSRDKYLALFNAGDSKESVSFDFKIATLMGEWEIRDLWNHRNLGTFEGGFSPEIDAHGAGLYRLIRK